MSDDLKMEKPGNESSIDMNRDVLEAQAIEIFGKIKSYLVAQEEREGKLQLWEASVDPSRTHDQFSDMDSEDVPQQLISGVIFRLEAESDQIFWVLENILDSVNISQLDEIRRSGNFEWFVNYDDDIRVAMAENSNVILMRSIMDWSREDGNVLSQEMFWSGSFQGCQRLLRLFDEGNNNTASVQFRKEDFSLQPQLREQFISRHRDHPVTASISAIYFSPSVIIDQGLLDASDEEDGFFCTICHDMIPIGFSAKQLPCKHLFHGKCITEWFFRQLKCPLCRDEFQNHAV